MFLPVALHQLVPSIEYCTLTAALLCCGPGWAGLDGQAWMGRPRYSAEVARRRGASHVPLASHVPPAAPASLVFARDSGRDHAPLSQGSRQAAILHFLVRYAQRWQPHPVYGRRLSSISRSGRRRGPARAAMARPPVWNRSVRRRATLRALETSRSRRKVSR